MAVDSVLDSVVDSTREFVGHCMAAQAASLRLADHQIDFLPGGRALVVTFEPAAIGKVAANMERPVWSQSFLQRCGHSVLGVKRVSTDWYRSPDLHRAFRALQDSGWFKTFEKVIFYGPSMGGYAALAFAACAPGCTVLALHPQSTLAPDRVWFDQRFAGRRAGAWQGDFVDGVDGAAAAARVYVCYDPYQVKDRLHADRLPQHNLIRLRMPFVGHTTAQALNALGVLGKVFDRALSGNLDERRFRRIARKRVRLADYHCRLAERGMWQPRRLRHLAQALAIDPEHPRARLLMQALADHPETPPPVAAQRVSRWPTGIVTAPRVPLVYLGIPMCASTAIQDHLLYIARGVRAEHPQDIDRHPDLFRSGEGRDEAHELIRRQIGLGAVAFTFIRHPGQRAYACFVERVVQPGPRGFDDVRQLLQRDWGVQLPGPGEALPLELQQQNFAAFLRFVEANLAGKTGIRKYPHWCPQGPMLVHYRRFVKIDIVGKVENFAPDMAQVLHRAGVHRIPDTNYRPWRHVAQPHSFAEVLTPQIQAQLDRLYPGDYKHLGYAGRAA